VFAQGLLVVHAHDVAEYEVAIRARVGIACVDLLCEGTRLASAVTRIFLYSLDVHEANARDEDLTATGQGGSLVCGCRRALARAGSLPVRRYIEPPRAEVPSTASRQRALGTSMSSHRA